MKNYFKAHKLNRQSIVFVLRYGLKKNVIQMGNIFPTVKRLTYILY
jgi:hypothetical protein